MLSNFLSEGRYVLGPGVLSLNRHFPPMLVPTIVGVANGTDALEIALKGVGIQSGDLVVTSANAGGYSTAAIFAIGAVLTMLMSILRLVV